MYKNYLHFLVIGLLGICFSITIQAQNEIGSPYSGYGIGLITNRTNGQLSSMGGVAYAMQSPYFINFKNPASYAAFDSLSFVADGAFSIYSSQLETTHMKQKGSFARADYLAIGFPITRHWRTSVGILPFSDLGYEIADSRTIDHIGKIDYTYSGTGGLIQLYWGNAFKLCKGLSFGLNVSYLFGNLNTINYEYFTESNLFNSRIASLNYLDGIYLSGGLQYFVNIKEKHKLGFGVVYENSAYIWSKDNLLVTNFQGNDYYYSSTIDTVSFYMGDNAIRGKAQMPQIIGGGISYNCKDVLLVGADVTWQNWKKFSLPNSLDTFKNALISSLGMQYTPDPISSNYLKKMSYRIGSKYSTGYLVLRDKAIAEFSISCGIGFPIKTFNFKSSLNLMFEYIHIGTTQNDLIAQNYYRFSLNFILNERWYQRVKLD